MHVDRPTEVCNVTQHRVLNNMKTLDWGLIKLQWELFGATAKDISDLYGVNPNIVTYAAEENGWKRLPIAKAVQEWTDTEDIKQIDDTLLDEVQTRLKVLHTIRESVLSPKYITVEAAILSKVTDVLQQMDTSDISAAGPLKMIADVFKILSDKNQHSILGDPTEGQKGGITLKILNHVGNKEQFTQQAIEVKVNPQQVDGPSVAPAETPPA